MQTADGFPDNIGNMWLKLTPDSEWQLPKRHLVAHCAHARSAPLFSSQLLKDGRLYVAGGEYAAATPTAEMYDPLSNTTEHTACTKAYQFRMPT